MTLNGATAFIWSAISMGTCCLIYGTFQALMYVGRLLAARRATAIEVELVDEDGLADIVDATRQEEVSRPPTDLEMWECECADLHGLAKRLEKRS